VLVRFINRTRSIRSLRVAIRSAPQLLAYARRRAADPKFLLARRKTPSPPWGFVMVGAGSPSRLGITHNNSHIRND
jgi:hypothetical protein